MLRAMQDGYRSLVRKLLRHKALVMITSVVLLVLSFMMAGQLTTQASSGSPWRLSRA